MTRSTSKSSSEIESEARRARVCEEARNSLQAQMDAYWRTPAAQESLRRFAEGMAEVAVQCLPPG